MKRVILTAVFLVCGIALLVVPLHMQMTGLVLCLLGGATAFSALLGKTGSTRCAAWAQTITILASAGVVILMSVMNLITAGGQTDWQQAKKADYAIVLGAAVKDTGGPSRIMGNRLDAAMAFMQENPNAVVILSGGQGSDEPTTEAQCMYETMIAKGADPDRLLMEDESHTTRENFINSSAIITARGGTDQPIAVITSEFHQWRAKFIADSLEIETTPVSARTDRWFYRVNYTLREVFAFVKAAAQRSGH